METELINLSGVLIRIPQIILCGAIALLIVFNLFNALNRLSIFIAITGIVAHLIADDHLSILNIIISLSAIVTIVLSGRQQRMEFYLFIVSLLLGAEFVATGPNFVIIVLSFELISISSYVLVAGNLPEKKRAEAAWKFFIYGSAATAAMIFGMSYYYGATGCTFEACTKGVIATPLMLVGSFMILAGFLFKMTAAPFHLWAPDVYEATPAPIVAFLSVAPKLAILFALRVVLPIIPSEIIGAVSILSMIIGTLAALSQTDAKRMMAYSSVAQAGIMLAAVSASATNALVFYIVVFAIMNYAAFILIGTKEKTAFTDFAGLGYTNPLATIAGSLALVSLVGLPPVAGFMGKLLVFTGVWERYNQSGQPIFLILFVTGLLATAASLYFYLKIPFYAFFRRSVETQPIKISLLTNLLLVILVGLLLTLFIAPGLVDGMGY